MSRASDIKNVEFSTGHQSVSKENFDVLKQRAFFLEPTDGITTGPPTTGTWALDELFIDVTRAVYRCTIAGTPGTWVLIYTPTPSGSSFANPTADVSLDGPTNGVASTAMRSDASPTLRPSAFHVYEWENFY